MSDKETVFKAGALNNRMKELAKNLAISEAQRLLIENNKNSEKIADLLNNIHDKPKPLPTFRDLTTLTIVEYVKLATLLDAAKKDDNDTAGTDFVTFAHDVLVVDNRSKRIASEMTIPDFITALGDHLNKQVSDLNKAKKNPFYQRPIIVV